jgi:uncharacterized lipoprotein YddW (UPF0748 family)
MMPLYKNCLPECKSFLSHAAKQLTYFCETRIFVNNRIRGMSLLSSLLCAVVSMSGVWSAWNYNTGNWAELAPLLSRNGYDTVFYCAVYGLESDTSGLQECIDACSVYDIDVHAWIVMWKVGKSTEQERELLAQQQRLQLSTDSNPDAGLWLCPSDPRNVADMAGICLDIATNYDIRGIHLDYIRYASNRVCFCDGCRERFGRSAGIRILNWPNDCAEGGYLYDQYNQWRASAITGAVASVRDSLNSLYKAVELSAAVLPRVREMDYFAQHWNDWLSRGLVDFVVPMNYTLSDSELVFWGESQLAIANRISIPCGLIVYKDDRQFTRDEIENQQATALQMGFDGWVMFFLGGNLISILEETDSHTRQQIPQ